MKNIFFPLSLIVSFLPLSLVAQTDSEVAARASVLELAGAFANDGFKLRDGHYSSTLEVNSSKLIAVNLYAGNEYWFIAGTGTEDGGISLDVFDNEGKPLATEPYHSPGRVAAGLSPVRSGRHYIRIRIPGDKPSAVCFLYSYR